jgi:hypothetical protein
MRRHADGLRTGLPTTRRVQAAAFRRKCDLEGTPRRNILYQEQDSRLHSPVAAKLPAQPTACDSGELSRRPVHPFTCRLGTMLVWPNRLYEFTRLSRSGGTRPVSTGPSGPTLFRVAGSLMSTPSAATVDLSPLRVIIRDGRRTDIARITLLRLASMCCISVSRCWS